MNRLYWLLFVLVLLPVSGYGQKTPTGNPADFRVKTCLHSIGYAGVWRGQATLTVDEFLVNAKQLGYDGVMIMANRKKIHRVCTKVQIIIKSISIYYNTYYNIYYNIYL